MQDTPQILGKIFEMSFQNHPKIHSKSTPKPSKTTLRKSVLQKQPKIEKNAGNGVPKGRPSVAHECGFRTL